MGVIAPWNFPVAGLYRSLFPALLLGNGAVLKPSEHASESSRWFVDHLAAELPPDLVSAVLGGPETGRALLDSGIDACAFTGSVSTGRSVEQACAERSIPCSAELGGKDHALVLGDCNLPRTVAGLTQWSLQNAGQACGAVEVVAVEASIADALVAGLQSAFARLRIGRDVGPLTHQRQVDIVDRQVREAVQQGARVVAGGRRAGAGLSYLPTLLDDCTPEMSVVRDETFGPVLPIVRVPNAYEAARLANASRYGLTASIWSEDIARAERLAERLNVGVITINNHAMTGALPELPWAGTRDSGSGIANSVYALTTFGQPQALLVDRSSGPEPFWLPYDDAMVELGHRLAEAQLGQVLRAYRIPLLIRQRIATLRSFFGMRS